MKDEEKERIRDLYKRGASPSTIAHLFGCSASTVCEFCKDITMETTKERPPLASSRRMYKDIHSELKVRPVKVREWLDVVYVNPEKWEKNEGEDME